MTRRILGEVDTNQFEDSLEENNENQNFASTNTTFEIKNKPIFYEIPNTPKSIKKRPINSKIRDEIRKSLSNTITIKKTLLEKQQQLDQLEKRRQFNKENSKSTVKKTKSTNNETKTLNSKDIDNNDTYIKVDKKTDKKNKEKICDVVYLKTIDNLLNAINTELEFGKLNLKFKDDLNYMNVFQENLIKLTSHLQSKIRFNAGLKIVRWYKNQLEIRNARKQLNELKLHNNKLKASIIIQKNWRKYLVQKKYSNLLNQKSEEREQINNLKLIQKYEQLIDKSARIIQTNWRIYQAKKQSNQLKLLSKQNRSASIIQKNWRIYLFKKNLNQLICEYRIIKQSKSASIIQRNWRNYLLKKNLNQLINGYRIIKQNKSASIIQKNWRNYQLRKNLNNLIRQHKIVKFNSSIKIQKAWKSYKLRKQIQSQIELRNKLKSIITIQSIWRMYLAKKQFNQLKLLDKQNKSAFIIQKNWRIYLFKKNLTNKINLNKIDKENRSALIIQKSWRSYQFRKQLNQRTIKRKEKDAAIMIQKNWRGHSTRVKQIRNNDKRLSGVFERVKEVNKMAENQPKIGEKTKIAIEKLLRYRYQNKIINVLKELESTTNLSNESCIQMANQTVIEVLLQLVRECNRSEPCLEIIKIVFSIILNIAKNDKSLPLLSSLTILKDATIEILNKHYKVTYIFLKAMTLLYILLKYENFPDSPAFTVKIKRLLNKISNEYTYSDRRNKKKIYQFEAKFLNKKNIRTQFYNTRQTLDAFYQIYNN